MKYKPEYPEEAGGERNPVSVANVCQGDDHNKTWEKYQLFQWGVFILRHYQVVQESGAQSAMKNHLRFSKSKFQFSYLRDPHSPMGVTPDSWCQSST